MSRKIDFLNSLGDTFTADGTNFLIITIDGLGTPDTNIQSQKAPYQDGSTYIDSLLDNRNITLEIAILAPNDFSTIDIRRREVVRKFNPKLGVGTLYYTSENGQQWKINAIPVSAPAFPNKDYRDPYLRFQVTFLCNDPYWMDVDSESISLPTSVNNDSIIVNASPSSYPTVIQMSDGSLYTVYSQNASPFYLKYRTSSDGVIWSSEQSLINSSVSYSQVIELNNGNMLLVYARSGSIYTRTSSDSGVTWSSETLLSATNVINIKLIKKINGDLMLFYRRQSDSYIVSITSSDGVTWSSENVINNIASSHPSVIQKPDGSFVIVYRLSSTGYLEQKTSSDGVTWSSESVINNAASTQPSLIIKQNEQLFLAYFRSSDGYIVYRESSDGITWTNESILVDEYSVEPCVVSLENSSLFILFLRFTGTPIIAITRSVTPIKATNLGDVATPVTIQFTGPATNPRIIKQSTLEYIRLNTTLAATDTMTINTAFGQKTITLNQGGIVKNGNAYLDLGSTFFSLDAGSLPDDLPIGVDVWNGQVGWWPVPDDFPEYPDNVAGTTYIQDAWATTDGWTGPTLVASGGVLKGTATSTATFEMYKTGFSATNKTVRARVRASKTFASFRIFLTIGGVAQFSTFSVGTDWKVIYADFSAVAGTVTIGGISALSGLAGDWIEIDWFYIGDGTYDTDLTDQSGNGYAGTVLGCTPDGDNGLIGDGVNDGIKIRDILSYEKTQPWTLAFLVKATAQSVDKLIIGKGYPGAAGYGVETLNTSLRVFLANSPSNRFAKDYTVNYYNGVYNSVIVTYDGSELISGINLYFNGILITGSNTVNTLTSSIITTDQFSFFARSDSAGTLSRFFPGAIKDPRIYNRALSGSEIKYLYDNPGIDYPSGANVVYFEDDSVASTATATMEWTNRYVGV